MHDEKVRIDMTKIAKVLPLLAVLLPAVALAWWNGDWKQRTAVTLNTSTAGVAVQETLSGVAIPVRLHSGNFDFVGAKPDGSDIRVLASDDKTPLKFWIERYDSVNELGLLWVLLPSVLPGSDKNTVYVYEGNDKAPADARWSGRRRGGRRRRDVGGVSFRRKGRHSRRSNRNHQSWRRGRIEPNGLLGQSARLTGTPLVWAANDKLKVASGSPFSVSLWARPDASAGTLYEQGPLQITLAGGKLNVKLGDASVAGGDLAAASWTQVVVTVAGRQAVGLRQRRRGRRSPLTAADPGNRRRHPRRRGLSGLVDELDLSGTARSADWIKLNYAAAERGRQADRDQDRDSDRRQQRRRQRATSGFYSRA